MEERNTKKEVMCSERMTNKILDIIDKFVATSKELTSLVFKILMSSKFES